MSSSSSSDRRLMTLSSHLTSSPSPSASSSSKNKTPTPSTSSFRYTLDNDVLSPAQRAFYEENGYIVIPKLVSEKKIDEYAAHFKSLCRDKTIRPPSMTVMRDVMLAKKGVNADSELTVTKVQDFQDDEILFGYCEDPAVLRYVECWTGKKIVASHTMLINKPTDAGAGTSRHPLHQDMLYFPFRPMDKVVAAWTAMEKVDRSNGCLIAVPGSHKTEILEHGYPEWDAVNKAYVGIMGVTPDVKYVHLPMEKGDTVFFHPLLWHGSGRNQTPNFRKAISCHFVSGDCNFISVTDTIQQDLEAELKEMAKAVMSKRFPGQEITEEMFETFVMADVWSTKSRIVQGGEMIGPIL